MTSKRFKQLLDKLNDERKKVLLLELYESATFVERLELIVITENYTNLLTPRTYEQPRKKKSISI